MEEVFEFARKLQAEGQYAEAEQCYRRYLEDHQDSFKALNNLGMVLDAQDQLPEAISCYKQAIELVPDEIIPRYNLGNAFYRQERYASAKGQFEQILERSPEYGLARLNLATVYWRQEDLIAAESHFRLACAQPDISARANSRLGQFLFDQGRFEEARACHLIAAEGEDAAAHYFNAALCDEVLGNPAEAASRLAQALQLDPTSRITHEHLVRALETSGNHEAVAAAFEAWSAALPGDAICEHMRAAFFAEAGKTRCSAEYIRDTFGAFAGDYDQTLARIGYRAPQVLAAGVRQHLAEDQRFDRVLDAGCGTGLCADLMRPLSTRLIGVDLAAPMLAQAQRLALYDELIEADLVDYLRDQDTVFDLVIAADTINYFGALDDLFAGVAKAVETGGRFVFTLEAGEPTETGYQLMPHGRFQHTRAYVEQALVVNGFASPDIETFVMREENGQNVRGWLIQSTRV